MCLVGRDDSHCVSESFQDSRQLQLVSQSVSQSVGRSIDRSFGWLVGWLTTTTTLFKTQTCHSGRLVLLHLLHELVAHLVQFFVALLLLLQLLLCLCAAVCLKSKLLHVFFLLRNLFLQFGVLFFRRFSGRLLGLKLRNVGLASIFQTCNCVLQVAAFLLGCCEG